ncbi:MAG: toll/interleukin-1 receptor domain-containing protein [Candidatus Bathyarchaeia archaeon]|jgi:hypothetical protein
MTDKMAPVVFISYSHDGSEHKRWVASLASGLLENGIQVVLDQWDLGLGDDVPKFMERNLATADRVLVICTETYVKKANEGTGGVGYEAMIVTAELVRNLGTSKFIPIVKQTIKPAALPICLGVRFYADFSDDSDFGSQLELVVRELHNQPLVVKPALGKSPFATQIPPYVKVELSAKEGNSEPANRLPPQSVTELYHSGIEVLSKRDSLSWRKLVQRNQAGFASQLASWRAKYQAAPPRDEKELIDRSFEAAAIFEPVICLSLAAVETGQDQFRKQTAIIDDILYIKGWDPSGYTVYTNINSAVAFLYQAVHGALAIQTNQYDLAFELATTLIRIDRIEKSMPLWKYPELVGWSTSFGQKVTVCWNVLMTLHERWKWIAEIFGSPDGYLSSLCAYYLFLDLLEYAEIFRTGDTSVLDQTGVQLEIPVGCLRLDEPFLQKAFSQLISNRKAIRSLLPELLREDAKVGWQKWVRIVRNWLLQVYQYPIFNDAPIGGLLAELLL